MKEDSSVLDVALVRLMNSYGEQRKILSTVQPCGNCHEMLSFEYQSFLPSADSH